MFVDEAGELFVRDEQQHVVVRWLVALAGVFILLGVLVARYYTLQISDFETYSTASERNRVQLQPLPPKRGLISSRNFHWML